MRMTQADVDRHEANLAARKKEAVLAAPAMNTHRVICLRIAGQIMGGKNNIGITRTGKRYPKAAWAAWRDEKVADIRRQWAETGAETFTQPVNMRLEYTAADHRRRDMPAILDSIFHVLEKAGVVADDTLLWVSASTRSYDAEHAGATIFLIW